MKTLEEALEPLNEVPEEHQELVTRIRAGLEVTRSSTGDLRITADALGAALELLGVWGKHLVDTALEVSHAEIESLRAELASKAGVV